MKWDPLFKMLTEYPGSNAIFNQYRDADLRLDRPDAAAIRRRNLACYLETFTGAQFVLVGEAAGYAGCRFSGIPFTCEAHWAGPDPLDWTKGRPLKRSSTAGVPWSERSARIVWQALGDRMDCVLWNAFPWHPFGDSGSLSNRTPGKDLFDGLEALDCLLSIFSAARAYAVGRVAQRALAQVGIQAPYIRHPSRGGKAEFLAGLAAL